MKREKYRILSLDASNVVGNDTALIGKQELKKYDNVLGLSLDAEEIKNAYKRVIRHKFSVKDENGVCYTDAVINVSFKYKLKDKNGKEIGTHQLRKTLYENGFYVNGVHYVRYKRSAGSSREGKCLFIMEPLLAHMEKWGECGLDSKNGDIASWEAYKALSLSTIKGVVNIPLDGILFVDDYVSVFDEEVVAVKKGDNGLVAERRTATIKNNIWDGESLLDESVFVASEDYSDKHMLLLRNKFFKSCAFRTKIQKWFRDNDIVDVNALIERGGVTLAKDISQIVMITTPSSLKYLKFVGDKLTLNVIKKWARKVSERFGVVKYDKRTKYFDGKKARSSYQMLNTFELNVEEAKDLISDNVDLLTQMRNDPAIMRYYFSHLANKEREYYEKESEAEGLAGRADVLFPLIEHNEQFRKTQIYYDFRDAVVKGIKEELKRGHVLLDGVNATLFGNGPELLKQAIGAFDANDLTLDKGKVRCLSFVDGQELVCARSPHITMGNLYLVTNDCSNDAWSYFDLGKNVVCVNAIGENIQQRLNGCDYDSDAMLMTSNPLLIEKAKNNYSRFKVPVCLIEEGKYEKQLTLADVDAKTSKNKIGEIVNLSQRLNSLLWARNNASASEEEIQGIYEDICKLAVLSGIEIDKAKRNYNVESGEEIAKISQKYDEFLKEKPQFFLPIDQEKSKKNGNEVDISRYSFYNTAMDCVYQVASNVNYRAGRGKKREIVELSELFDEKPLITKSNDYNLKKKIITELEEHERIITGLRTARNKADSEKAEVLQEEILLERERCKKEVLSQIKSPNVLKLVLQDLEKAKLERWVFYSILLAPDNAYLKELISKNGGKLQSIREDPTGDITLCGYNFTKY